MKLVIVIGGGAAGFFAAVTSVEKDSSNKVLLFEKAASVLGKVKISGGGRCNVTHACFDPETLSENYPRGKKELKGLFYKFDPSDTINWFESKGVKLKIENDNRVFPVSDSSQTIIDCLLDSARSKNIDVLTHHPVIDILPPATPLDKWSVITKLNERFYADKVIVTSGSSYSVWDILKKLGHTIISPVPSLFTFVIDDKLLNELQGISVEHVEISTDDKKLFSRGPLLITHKGISGPAVLKLSAFGARVFNEPNYDFQIKVNWLPRQNLQTINNLLREYRSVHLTKHVLTNPFPGIPRRLWKRILELNGVEINNKWNSVSNEKVSGVSQLLTETKLNVTGRNTNKEEFVTAGGVKLEEVDFRDMQSRLHKGLYFAGEVLDIDGLTGGYNFQAAWTTGYIAGSSI